MNSCANDPTPPFGDGKASGIGREHDHEGLEFFTELETINLGGGLTGDHALDLVAGPAGDAPRRALAAVQRFGET